MEAEGGEKNVKREGCGDKEWGEGCQGETLEGDDK